MKIYWMKINKIVDETPEVKTYYLDTPEGYTWEEGAHIHLGLEGFNAGEKPNKGLVRHLSISTVPNEGTIGVTTRIKEKCSEYKEILRDLEVGDKVAVFKTHSNVPLVRENKRVYLLSAGVGLATFRPLVLEYFDQPEGVEHIHSLNIDSSQEYLFPNIFKSSADKNFTSEFVDNRKDYYDKVEKLGEEDTDGLFYIVGSDRFLVQNIGILNNVGVKKEQIMLDKHKQQRAKFLPVDVSV